jgi:predicted ATP-dependent protease
MSNEYEVSTRSTHAIESDNAKQFKKWFKAHMGKPKSSHIANAAIAELEAESQRLKDRLEQYESTPARALKAVMDNHDIQIEAGTKGMYPIELSIMHGPNCIAEILDDYPILKA